MKATAAQQQMIDETLAKVERLLGDEKRSPAVNSLILDLTGRVMQAIEAEKEEDVTTPSGAFFALGMVANAVASIVATITETPGGDHKNAAMAMMAYAMKQTVIAHAAKEGEEPFMKMHQGPLQ